MDHSGRPGRAEQILALISTLVMGWFMMPEHQRKLIVMRALAWAARVSGRLAATEGHAGMGDELAGRDPAARYGGAYFLARCRDELAGAIERLRP